MYKATLILTFTVCLIATLVAAKPKPDDKDNRGGFSIDVNQERGQGTKVDARGRQEIWRSNDGNSRAEVYGHWDRVYGGSNNGQRSYGGGMRLEHSWGK